MCQDAYFFSSNTWVHVALPTLHGGCWPCFAAVLLQIVMGTFIVSFIGNSFITNTIDSQLLAMVQPQRDVR
jgi:uncharacterized membrane protein YdjX (TVP38/TMEM64 family)